MFFGWFLEHLADSCAGIGVEQTMIDAVVENLVDALAQATHGLQLAIGFKGAQ
ncbi:hypothetical protein D3C76_1464870 [compost metagenome]